MRGGWLGRIGRGFVHVLLVFAIALSALWIGFCLYFQLPFGDAGRTIAIAGWALFAIAVIVLTFSRRKWPASACYVVAVLVFGAWWSTILPSNDRDWAPDVAHSVSGTVDGDIVTLHNVRNFGWRTDEDFTPRWETRTYDLSQIKSVDLILAYWAGPTIAHTIVTFGFENGDHVSFSAEIRREKTQAFSAIAGFFRVFTLVLVAADERDVVHLRTNVRKEDVYLYPLGMPKAGMRALFLSYVDAGNALNAAPKFYNTLTTNCTTVVFRLIRALDPGLPVDYRILISGHLPSYVFDHQGYQTGLSYEEFRRRAAISALGLAAGDSPDFSSAIRPPTGLFVPRDLKYP
ncbi:DUF4105 domain-containing protein [Kaistia dalseonensis]|uniref:Lnb N-terminal periplasmic domain-containing protein n=1 Tax=Kaistia dalseonensis TaxID=410840 RepID=A0ABU0H6P5_9HYPH|nr:DUF4105 domain-containing protein [Kaistia dalseonensis]MCX5494967.1 DUF4105 domain-containing protein [Kaistia dalseonensis]MDQ0437548.1 hypothetical protein [Kaistia dalseonensis]